MSSPATIVVLLTPPGRGAVASLLVAGPAAAEWLAAEFRPRGARPWQPAVDQLRVGLFGAAPGEPVVIRSRAATSFEVHCHGGTAAVGRIATRLTARGAQTVAWRDWIRAAANATATEETAAMRAPIEATTATTGAVNALSPAAIAAEARVALAAATTFRTASILLDQHGGALARAVAAVESALNEGDGTAARQQCETLLQRAALGRRLVEPWRVVLAGEANAGKSSLLNALLGYRRAIVHAAQGTTRDVLRAATAIDGWPVELIDTAGLRPTQDAVEAAGVAAAETVLREADLVVLLVDGSQPPTPTESRLAARWPAALLVESKADLPRAAQRGGEADASAGPFDAREPRPAIAVSAVRGAGLTELLTLIAARLVPDAPPPGAAVPFTAEQVAQLTALHARACAARSR